MQKEAKLGEESKFFYDKERGMWREHGAAAPEPAAPLAPPPVIRQPPEGTPPGAPPFFICLSTESANHCFAYSPGMLFSQDAQQLYVRV